MTVSPYSEQRKKYSNSNVIMHETSQYHVQVSPSPHGALLSSVLWGPRARGETEAGGEVVPQQAACTGVTPRASLQSWGAPGLRGTGTLKLHQGEGCQGQHRKANTALGAPGNPSGRETVILASQQGARLGGRSF